jgi:hypothetical protein
MKKREFTVDFRIAEELMHLPTKDLPIIKNQTRKKQALKSLHPHDIMGADTETVHGRVWLFSTERGVWEIETFADLVDILWNKEHSRQWKKGKVSNKNKNARGITPVQMFFWNLKFDAQAILHLIDDDIVLDILADNQAAFETTLNDGSEVVFEIRYLEGKSLQITPKNYFIGQYKCGTAKWWDISQFYGKGTLHKTAQNSGFEGKVELCEDGTKLDASRFNEEEYRIKYRDDIFHYAVQDAILAGKLARKKREEFLNEGIRFIEPYSLANVAQRFLLDNSVIPTINDFASSDIGRELLRKALTAYRGGHFETLGSGMIPKAILLDLASAYPYVMRWISDVSKGYFVHGTGNDHFFDWLDDRRPFSIGFAEAFVIFNDGLPIHPLCVGSAPIITPRIVRGWFTADELAEARKWPHSQFFIGEWFYHVPESDYYPYRKVIDTLYEKKMQSKSGTPAYQVSKVLINSLYGKTIQAVNDKAGKLWNPLASSVITGATRARLAELVRLNDFKAVSLATDGVMFRSSDLHTIPVRPLPAPYNLGEWELEAEGPALIAMSGVYSMDKGDKISTTFRGSTSLFLREYCEPRGSGGLFKFCADNYDEEVVRTTHNRPFSAKEARVRSDISLMNQFEEFNFSFRALGDSTKRIWGTNRPQTFGDLLTGWWDSNPHQHIETVSLLGGET